MDERKRVPREVLFTLRRGAPTGVEEAVAQSLSLQILERTELQASGARLVRLFIPDGRLISEVTAALGADQRVTLAQPNHIYTLLAEPLATPAALRSTEAAGIQYALAKAGVNDAHSLAQGRGARIAVIDSGIDRTHPDLSSAQIEEFDASSDGATPGTPTDAAAARPVDDHGTAIAGIIAARGHLTGVAPEARVLSARIFRRASPSAPPTATTAGLLKGLDWAIANGARVINMSLAGPEDPLVEQAIKAAAARGIIAVAAAGNGGPDAEPVYPAAYADVIAVTAIDADDKLYEKANRGTYVAIAAPGVDVLVPARDRSHRFDSGTSLAAAHVSGIVALMLELEPGLTVEGARNMLATSSLDLGRSGRDEEFGAGRVDAAAALRRLSAGPVASARR